MKKNFSLIISCFIILTCFLPLSVYAQENVVNGDLSYEEGGKRYVPTIDDMMLRIEKERKIKERELREMVMPRLFHDSGISSQKILDVDRFIQSKYYYCGPATVKQVLHFLRGESNTQDYYARQLGTTTAGTDMTVIPKVLNAELGKRTYYYDEKATNFHRWRKNILASIDEEFPAILDVRITDAYKAYMGYTTEGHYMNVAGYREAGSGELYIKVTDPYEIPKKNNEPKKVTRAWIDVDTLYDINMAHFRHAMIW